MVIRSRPKILICAYGVDRQDVSEAQMAYEWISRLSRWVDLIVVTAGSRIHPFCGLEGMEGVQLELVHPRVSFRWWDAFDRFVHPAYVEFYWQARKKIQSLISRETIQFGHHLAPQALRYPSPLSGLPIPFLAGPYHGGLQSPAVMKELQGRESAFYFLRKLDTLRMRYDPVLRKHFEKAHRIIISAPYVLQQLREYETKCVVLPGVAMNPSEVTRCQQGLRSPVRMIFVGKLEPSKGVELLLYALSMLKNSDWVLDIYGVGAQAQLYQAMAEKLGLNEKIRWRGFVVNVEVLKDYQNADLFVFPSLKEPAGGALLEAMAAGLPVICVDAGGPAYAATEECGIKIPLRDKEKMTADLADAIDRMLGDPALRQEMGSKAMQRFLDEFTWDRVVQKMVDLYQETLMQVCPEFSSFRIEPR